MFHNVLSYVFYRSYFSVFGFALISLEGEDLFCNGFCYFVSLHA